MQKTLVNIENSKNVVVKKNNAAH